MRTEKNEWHSKTGMHWKEYQYSRKTWNQHACYFLAQDANQEASSLCLHSLVGDTWHHKSILVAISDTLSKRSYTAATSVRLLQHEVYSCFLKRSCSALCKSVFKEELHGFHPWCSWDMNYSANICRHWDSSFRICLVFSSSFLHSSDHKSHVILCR